MVEKDMRGVVPSSQKGGDAPSDVQRRTSDTDPGLPPVEYTENPADTPKSPEPNGSKREERQSVRREIDRDGLKAMIERGENLEVYNHFLNLLRGQNPASIESALDLTTRGEDEFVTFFAKYKKGIKAAARNNKGDEIKALLADGGEDVALVRLKELLHDASPIRYETIVGRIAELDGGESLLSKLDGEHMGVLVTPPKEITLPDIKDLVAEGRGAEVVGPLTKIIESMPPGERGDVAKGLIRVGKMKAIEFITANLAIFHGWSQKDITGTLVPILGKAKRMDLFVAHSDMLVDGRPNQVLSYFSEEGMHFFDIDDIIDHLDKIPDLQQSGHRRLVEELITNERRLEREKHQLTDEEKQAIAKEGPIRAKRVLKRLDEFTGLYEEEVGLPAKKELIREENKRNQILIIDAVLSVGGGASLMKNKNADKFPDCSRKELAEKMIAGDAVELVLDDLAGILEDSKKTGIKRQGIRPRVFSDVEPAAYPNLYYAAISAGKVEFFMEKIKVNLV